MNLNTKNLEFILQNNPEHAIIEIIESIKELEEQAKYFDSDINALKYYMGEFNKKFEYKIWLSNVSWFRKLWWKIRKYDDNKLLTLYKKEKK